MRARRVLVRTGSAGRGPFHRRALPAAGVSGCRTARPTSLQAPRCGAPRPQPHRPGSLSPPARRRRRRPGTAEPCGASAAPCVRLAARQALVIPASSPLGVGLGDTQPLTSRHPDFDVSLAKGIDLSCPGNPPLPSASRRGHATRSFILRRVAPCVPCGAPSPVSRPVGVGCHWPPVTDVSHGDSCPVGTAGLLVGRKKASITGGLLGGGRGGVTAVAERDGGLCFLNSRTELPEIDGNPSAKFGNNPRRLGAQAIAETVRFRRNCARFRGRGGSTENRTGAHRSGAENTGAARKGPERAGTPRSGPERIGRHRTASESSGDARPGVAGVHRSAPATPGPLRNAPDSPGTHRRAPERTGAEVREAVN